jgi:hypothetical protein
LRPRRPYTSELRKPRRGMSMAWGCAGAGVSVGDSWEYGVHRVVDGFLMWGCGALFEGG